LAHSWLSVFFRPASRLMDESDGQRLIRKFGITIPFFLELPLQL
jgi:hypothetical protein